MHREKLGPFLQILDEWLEAEEKLLAREHSARVLSARLGA